MEDPKITVTFGEDGKTCEVEFEGSPPKCTLLARALREQADDVVRMASENRIEYSRMMEARILEDLAEKASEIDPGMMP